MHGRTENAGTDAGMAAVLRQVQPNTATTLDFGAADLCFLAVDDAAAFARGVGALLGKGLFAAARDGRPAGLRTTLALAPAGLRALGLPAVLIECLGEPFAMGMAVRAGLLRDGGANAPLHWEEPYGRPQVGALLLVHAHEADADPTAALARRLGWRGADAAALFARRFGARLLRLERGRRVRDRAGHPLNGFGFVDGLSQPADGSSAAGLTPYFLDLAEGPEAADRMAREPWRRTLAAAAAALPAEAAAAYRALAGRLAHGTAFLVYRKIAVDPRRFEAAAAAVAVASGLSRRAAAEALVGRRKDGYPIARKVDRRVTPEQANGFDFSDDPLGALVPRGSHVRRVNPRRDSHPESGVPFNGAEIQTGPGGLPVGPHGMLRRGIRFRDGDGLHFMALVGDIERQFEFLQREWLNKGDFIGQPTAARDPVASTDGARTLFEVRVGGRVRHVPIDVPARLAGGDYFLVPGQAFLAALAGGLPRGLPELPDTPSPVPAGTAIVDPAERLRQIAGLSRGGSAVVTAPTGVRYVCGWADGAAVLADGEAYSSGHYLRRIHRLTGGADFALGMPLGEPHTAQRQAISALLAGRRQPRWPALPRFAGVRPSELLFEFVWPRLVRLIEAYLPLTVPEEPDDAALGEALGDVELGRYRQNYPDPLWRRFYPYDPASAAGRQRIKADNLRAVVRRMGLYIIGISETAATIRLAEAAAASFRSWLTPQAAASPAQAGVAMGLVVAACGTLEKAAGVSLDRILRDPAAAAAAREPAGGMPVDAAAMRRVLLEALRLDPVLPALRRDTLRPVRIAGTDIPAGAPVVVLAAAALRDPRQFGVDADRFRADRGFDGGMVFGLGPHRCSGEDLGLDFLVALARDLLAAYELVPLAGPTAGLQYGNPLSTNPVALNVGLVSRRRGRPPGA